MRHEKFVENTTMFKQKVNVIFILNQNSKSKNLPTDVWKYFD